MRCNICQHIGEAITRQPHPSRLAPRHRPLSFMLYIHEKTIDGFVAKQGLPVIENRCPVDKITKRTETKELIYELSAKYPDLKERIFGAMQRLPLPEWEPKGRYKRPKDEYRRSIVDEKDVDMGSNCGDCRYCGNHSEQCTS